MALTASDFVEPSGELQAEWYPLSLTETEGAAYADDAAKLTALLAGWLAAAAARGLDTEGDYDDGGAAVAYVYRRAYAHVARRIEAAPASGSASGVGSYSYFASQVEAWSKRLAEIEAAADPLTPSVYDGWPVVHSLR